MKQQKAYVAFFAGDIAHLAPLIGQTLDQTLIRIRDEYGFGQCKSEEVEEGEIWHNWKTPDPEDDKIEVWEIDAHTGSCKIVWGFWGWHWTPPDDLEQGTIPDCPSSLYELAMERY